MAAPPHRSRPPFTAVVSLLSLRQSRQLQTGNTQPLFRKLRKTLKATRVDCVSASLVAMETDRLVIEG